MVRIIRRFGAVMPGEAKRAGADRQWQQAGAQVAWSQQWRDAAGAAEHAELIGRGQPVTDLQRECRQPGPSNTGIGRGLHSEPAEKIGAEGTCRVVAAKEGAVQN